MGNLENKVKEKPDWKQWTPGYGAIQILQDREYERPIIYDNKYFKKHPTKVILCSLYQVPFIFITILPFFAYNIASGRWHP